AGALRVPQPRQRGVGPPGGRGGGRPLRPDAAARPALAHDPARVRLLRPRADRAEAEPAGPAGDPSGDAEASGRAEAGGRASEALRPGHGCDDVGAGARTALRLGRGRRGRRLRVDDPLRGQPRVGLRVLPRLQDLRPADARRARPRRGVCGLQRHLVTAERHGL
ncbi:MAG: FIG01106253: hypothetical protein, partial [uncultured Acidimicrobiales bacterium]